MSVITELIRTEADGAISFGNYELKSKTKVSDFEHNGDLYKVKTYNEITKLECNGRFAYESVPGTAVTGFQTTEDGLSFTVEGREDAQIIVGVKDDTEYALSMDGQKVDEYETDLSGKLVFSVELEEGKRVAISIQRVK